MSMLSVDYRQIQQRLQKLEGEHRQENEKVKLKFEKSPTEIIRSFKYIAIECQSYTFKDKFVLLKIDATGSLSL